MKKILLIYNHYRTPQDKGGLRSWHVGTRLAKSGHKVIAIIPGVDSYTGVRHHSLKGGNLWSSEKIDGVEVVRVNSIKNDRTSKLCRVLYYITYPVLQFVYALSVKKVDIVISMSIPTLSMASGWFLSKRNKALFVIDARDLPIDHSFEIGYIKWGYIYKILAEFEKMIYSVANLIITVSWGMKKVIIDKGVDENRIKVIPIGYDGGCLRKVRKTNFKSKLGLNNRFLVVYAGTIGFVFDVKTIIEAAKRTKFNRNIVYLFVGDGQRINEFRDISYSEKLMCIFVGRKSRDEVPEYIQCADVCVLPFYNGRISRTNLGNKIFEYLGAGKPTIYTGPEGDAKQLIEDSKGGICLEACDSEGLANKITELSEKRESLGKLGRNAQSFINRYYMIDRMMDMFAQTIDDCTR